MRILCLAFIDGQYAQLMRKLMQQAKAFVRQGAQCDAYILGEQELKNKDLGDVHYVRMPWSWPAYCAAADALIQQHQPDVVYFRYPLADEALVRLLRRHNHIVFEHNAIEIAEVTNERLRYEQQWGEETLSLAAGLCCVTEEILVHERQRAGKDVPGFVMGNGIDPAAIAPLAFHVPDDAIHMLCAANFSPWHGVDRLLEGMAAYKGPEKFVLHLAGTGSNLPCLLAHAERLGLSERVHSHGWLDRKAMDALASRCHIGVGPLARHRTALSMGAPLKVREYCLQGLPFIFAAIDPDFSPPPPFTHTFLQEESPIDMDIVGEFAHCIRENPALRNDMRAYAERPLAWGAKAGDILALFERCAAQRPTAKDRPYAVTGTPGSVAMVICCPAGLEGLRNTLASLAAQSCAQAEGAQQEILVCAAAAHRTEAESLLTSLCGHLSGCQCAFVAEECPTLGSLRNAALRHTHSQWYIPLLAGDTLRADTLDNVRIALRSQPHINVLAARAEDQTGTALPPPPECPDLSKEYALPGMLAARKSLWEDVGGYDTTPWIDTDVNFWLQGITRECLVQRRLPRTLLTRTSTKERSDVPTMFRQALLFTQHARLFPLDIVITAHQHLAHLTPELQTYLMHMWEQHPALPLPWFWMGLVHEGRGNPQKALACHMKAFELDTKNDWQASLRLALLFQSMGNHAQAAAYQEHCVARNPGLAALFAMTK